MFRKLCYENLILKIYLWKFQNSYSRLLEIMFWKFSTINNPKVNSIKYHIFKIIGILVKYRLGPTTTWSSAITLRSLSTIGLIVPKSTVSGGGPVSLSLFTVYYCSVLGTTGNLPHTHIFTLVRYCPLWA